MKNEIVINATGSKFDKWEMTINNTLEHDIRFASMVIGYKIYFSSKENYVFCTIIYTAYELMRETKKYDLCEFLRSELTKNIKKIKENKKNPFKFGTVLLCLFFYFMKEVPGICLVEWAFDRPVGVQIQKHLYNSGDSKV